MAKITVRKFRWGVFLLWFIAETSIIGALTSLILIAPRDFATLGILIPIIAMLLFIHFDLSYYWYDEYELEGKKVRP